MPINKQSYKITGMRQDNLVNTGTSDKYAHEIKNMRLNTIGDFTTGVWTNERSTKEVIVNKLEGYTWITDKTYTDEQGLTYHYEVKDFQPIGQANINDYWVLFGIVENKKQPLTIGQDPLNFSVILSLCYIGNILYGRILFWGNLGFNLKYPIETLPFYENENILKIYWTDGLNQPRVINIKGAELIQNASSGEWDNHDGFNPDYNTQFDFVQEVSLNENVEITKNDSGEGLFPPCTVKYAITYYHKYGQETNVIYDSPLYYPIMGNRACSEDELSGDSFSIKVTNLDLNHGFDYIRLYSIIRTSENATPIVRIVADKPITKNTTEILFVDTNTTGKIIDPTILNYIGGRHIIAKTFDQKDNTLFLGDIELKTKSVGEILKKENIKLETSTDYLHFVKDDRDISIRPDNTFTFYPYTNQLNPIAYVDNGTTTYYNGNSQAIKTFKKGEWYRFGIQFQDNKGVWSEVMPLKDLQQDKSITTHINTGKVSLPSVEYILSKEISIKLYRNDYKKARLVCCYPNNSDRSIIAQGILCPTVYNYSERNSSNQGTPYAMASWFFRPNDNPRPKNYSLEWKHNERLTHLDKINLDSNNKPIYRLSHGYGHRNYEAVEIQSMCPTHRWDERDDHRWDEGVDHREEEVFKSSYYVDRTIWTFNSPEIDFDESIRTLPREGFTIHVIGAIPINDYASNYYVEADSPGVSYKGYKGSGFKSLPYIRGNDISVNFDSIGSHALNTGVWYDNNWYNRYLTRPTAYPLYPFQRKGSLSNYMRDIDFTGYDGDEETFKVVESGVLKSKVLAHLIYSNNTLFNDTEYPLSDVQHIDIFDSNEVLPTKLSVNNSDKIYYGNVNTIAPIETLDTQQPSADADYDDTLFWNARCYTNEYNSSGTGNTKNLWFNASYYLYEYGDDGDDSNPIQKIRRMAGVSSDPVPITYKSTPHAVFYSNMFINNGGIDETFKILLNSRPQRYPSYLTNYLYLAEIRRDVNAATRFGGSIENSNIQNIYLPCGPAYNLSDTSAVVLKGTEGDHYFMRYDCLKTYPYATDDTNQIVEILSFMCETRINLDGRYDKNRGLTDNTTITNTNFNLINKSYSQSNNFFSYTTLDELSASLDRFGNQFTWTKPKTAGEDIDTWTNITLASTADATGTLGNITKILNLNDNLYLLQEHGIAVIGFNEKTAIPTETGVPLELANTGKYTGLKYISSNIGCQNKWSISNTKNGVFFIDDTRQELLALGEQLISLSTINGFDTFLLNNLPKQFESWNPATFNNFVTYYDKVSNDIYYINKNYCLAWNEQSKTFTSFYSYENTPYMTNLGMHSMMWHNGIYAAREDDSYNKFFGAEQDYWITLVCDGITSDGNAFPADKVFNNVEYRADVYNEPFNGINPALNFNASIFNIKHIWNGYQDSNDCDLDGIRKFNTWRIQLPRHHSSRDRIRSPFCYINLKQNQHINSQTNRAILHDLAVYFDMK